MKKHRGPIPGVVFVALYDIKQKLRKKVALTPDEAALLQEYGRQFAPNLCGCGCKKPLEPRVDGERHRIKGKEVNAGCYFAAFGEEIEKYPIGGHGIRRCA